MFWRNFLVECAKRQKSPATVVEELGISNSMPTSWKKGAIPQKRNQEKIARYFGITVEELMQEKENPAGQGEVKVLFWENFVKQCEKLEKSPSIVSEELGFNRSAVTAWKNGALPRVASRKKIADYFGITVDELMGTKKEPAGDGGLNDEMKEILEYAEKMSPEDRKAFLTLLRSSAKK